MIFGSGTPDVQKMKENRDVEGLIKALGYEQGLSMRDDAAIAHGGKKE
jgi:hypothetical protein